MSNLSRVNFIAQQRLDLSHLLSAEAFNAFDFRALVTFFTGSNDAYVVRGYEIVNKSQLSVQISTADSLVFNPQDQNGSFYFGLSSSELINLTLAADKTFYVEAVFANQTQNPVNTAFWNPLALNQDDAAGNEFSASTNSQNVLILTIPAPNLTGFTPGAIPLFKITTATTQIKSIVDCRPMLFRLGTGGSVPNPGAKFPWAVQRREAVSIGAEVGQDELSPFLAKDGSGILNDKGLSTLKEWMDAVMTRIAELTGSPLWYGADLSGNYIDGLNLNSVFFDSPGGHSINPSDSATIRWTKGLALRSEGLEPVEWQANYNSLKWRLGGTFTQDASGHIASRSLDSSPRFSSPVPADGGNIYLRLKRDIPITIQDNPVNWKPNAVPDCFEGKENRIITGLTGDFRGLAIGDYVRKASEGYSRYYEVVEYASDNSTTSTKEAQSIADDTVTAILVSRVIEGSPSTEPVRMFQSNYDSTSILADTSSSAVAEGTFNYPDIDCYWLGRRVGSNFILRGYGSLEPGQEIRVLGAGEFGYGYGESGPADIFLEHAFGASFSGLNYFKKTSPGTLLTLRRRKRNNEVETADPSNAGSLLTYSIQSPGLLNFEVGHSLWVKLSDQVDGVLTAGSVTSSDDDINNTETNRNVYEVRSPANSPLRSFDNKDVVQIARCISPGVLQFYDGSYLNSWGLYLNGLLEVQGDSKFDADVYLDIKTPRSVLWVDDLKRIQEDNANFYYDVDDKYLQVFNHRLGVDYLDIENPKDQRWLESLGQNTVTIGTDASTIKVLGNLVVVGKTIAEITPVIVTEDSNITVGAGNAENGGGGSGISVADSTHQVSQASAVSGYQYVDLTYASPHNYTSGIIVTVNSSASVGSIQSGDMNSTFAVVTGASSEGASGTAQVVSPTKLRIHTGVTSSKSVTLTLTGPDQIRSFITPSFIQMTSESGSASGMTSWGFRVKNVAQTVTLTPALGYDVVPTAKSGRFKDKRVPFACLDGSGPSGSDTTLSFSDHFTWEDEYNTLTVIGTEKVEGFLKPWNTIAQSNLSESASYNNTVEIRDSIVATGKTLTDQYALRIKDLSSGAKNYGIFSEVVSGSQKWNIYVAGTADSYIENTLSLGQKDQTQITSKLTIGTANSVQPSDGILLGSDANLYRLEPGVLRTDVGLETGKFHRFVNQYDGTPATPPPGKVSVFASNGLIWQIDSNGVVHPLTTPLGNVYEEVLAVKDAGASGNNEINLSALFGQQILIAEGGVVTISGPSLSGLATILVQKNQANIGQYFSESGALSTVSFNIKRTSGSVGSVSVRVYSIYESGLLNKQIAESQPVAISLLPTSLEDVSFSFSTPLRLAGEKVAIVLYDSSVDGVVEVKPVQNAYDKGSAVYSPLNTVALGYSYDYKMSATLLPIYSQPSILTIPLPLDSRSLPDPNQRRTYMVGTGDLEVYLNGVLLENGVDYQEVGTAGYASYTIMILPTINVVAYDRFKFRIGTNGGMFMVGGSGGAGFYDLQGAYSGGNSIRTQPGVPLLLEPSLNNDTALEVRGDVNVWNSAYVQSTTFKKTPTRPFSTTKNGLWVNNQGDLIYEQADSYNLSDVARKSGTATTVYLTLPNYGLSPVAIHTPISINRTGSVSTVDVSNEGSAVAALGLAVQNIAAGSVGKVVTAGKIENVSISAQLGDVLYIDKTGALTTVKPSIGVNGFDVGDFAIRVGVVTENIDTPTNKDIAVSVQIIGQL